MRRILADHAARYPLWALDDLYKLLHQAALGSEHAVRDEALVRDWLTQEIASLSAGPEEPLIDSISPGGEVVRVHLRPYGLRQLEPEVLLDGFLRTAREYRGLADHLVEYARIAVSAAHEGILPFGANEIAEYATGQEQAAFPTVHHSPVFEAAYRPAYRVVARSVLSAEILAAA
jgi:hypothetical protein